jgi:hypothetical protein
VAGLASGGPIRGAGTGTSDSIIARLSAGEYVLRAAAVKNYGLSFLEKLNAMRVPRFAAGGLVPTVPRFSSGGPVGVPVNIYLPDGQSFPMTAQPSVAKTLGRILSHEVLKRGRR